MMGSPISKEEQYGWLIHNFSCNSCPRAHPACLYHTYVGDTSWIFFPNCNVAHGWRSPKRKHRGKQFQRLTRWCKVFLYLVGYVGDYRAVTDITDFMGHNSLVYFHLLSVRKYDNSGNGSSFFVNDPDRTSTMLSLHLSAQRCESVRKCLSGKNCDSTLNTLGLLKVQETSWYSSLFQKLFREFERARPHVWYYFLLKNCKT